MSALRISAVERATETVTRDYDATAVIKAIRTGGKKVRGQVEGIRDTLKRELAAHGDERRAKQAAGELKKQLPAVLWSGRFTQRANDKLVSHSGLLCADLDGLN
ncbi:MAG TPA: BT4734/BF3469 family protein, partial [Candidatus Udaeobacter sp.]|nr:BT4734/BF3469 family protein [Candidatus Udaeobacter sp.]